MKAFCHEGEAFCAIVSVEAIASLEAFRMLLSLSGKHSVSSTDSHGNSCGLIRLKTTLLPLFLMLMEQRSGCPMDAARPQPGIRRSFKRDSVVCRYLVQQFSQISLYGRCTGAARVHLSRLWSQFMYDVLLRTQTSQDAMHDDMAALSPNCTRSQWHEAQMGVGSRVTVVHVVRRKCKQTGQGATH